MVENLWKTLWISIWFSTKSRRTSGRVWKREKFYRQFKKLFHCFWMKKVINLLSLHQNGQIVDKLVWTLSTSKKELTLAVENREPRVDNEICKKMGKKFSTYPHHIIQFISIFL